MRHTKARLAAFAAIPAGVFLVFWAGAPTPLYPAVLIGGYDAWFSFGPRAFFMDWAIHHGEFPLWNPLTFTGQPYLADTSNGTLYPLNLLRSALTVHPTPEKTLFGLVVLNFVHTLVAGAATFLLSRSHGLSRPASVAAAFCYVLSGQFVRLIVEVWSGLVPLAALPILLFLVRRGIQANSTRRQWACGLSIALVLSATLLAGISQFFIYLLVALAAYALLHLAVLAPGKKRTDPSGARYERKRVCPFSCHAVAHFLFGATIFIVLPFALTLLLGAVQILPGVEFAQATGRMKGADLDFGEYFLPRGAWWPVEHLLAYAGSPGVEGRRAAGAGAVILALVSFTYFRRRDWVVWAALLYVLLDCSLGPPWPVAWAVDVLTPFHIRLPSRALMFACLPLGVLAGMGVDAATARLKSFGRDLARLLLIAGVSTALLVLLSRWLEEAAWLSPSIFVLAAPIALAAVAATGPWIASASGTRTALAALLLLELVAWNREYLPFLYSRVHEAEFQITAERLRSAPKFSMLNVRTTDLYPNSQTYSLVPAMNGFSPTTLEAVRTLSVSAENEAIYSHWIRADEITARNHRGNLLLKRSFWLARQWVAGPLPAKDSLFPPTTTVYLAGLPELEVPQVTRNEVPARSISTPGETFSLPIRLVPTLPRGNAYPAPSYSLSFPKQGKPRNHGALILTVDAPEGAEVSTAFLNEKSGRTEFGFRYLVEAKDGLQRLEVPLPALLVDRAEVYFGAKTGLAKTGTVPSEERAPRTVPTFASLVNAEAVFDADDEDGFIEILSRGANHVSLKVGPLPGPRILTFVDAAYPGWRARVDGIEVEILKAADAYKAIELASGTHRVEFDFRSKTANVGAVVSVATALAVILALIGLLLPRRPTPAA